MALHQQQTHAPLAVKPHQNISQARDKRLREPARRFIEDQQARARNQRLGQRQLMRDFRRQARSLRVALVIQRREEVEYRLWQRCGGLRLGEQGDMQIFFDGELRK